MRRSLLSCRWILQNRRIAFGRSVVLPILVYLLAMPTFAEPPPSSTVFGSRNPQLVEGSQAMLAGRYDVGIRLTLEGLQDTDDPRDAAAGHSNLCAGYASLKRWQEALQHCDRSLELDADNWRTYNNRAAVNLGLGHLDQALRDIEAGLALAPQSSTLKLSREIVEQHRRVKRSRDRRAIKA